jgi:hypothetical protein
MCRNGTCTAVCEDEGQERERLGNFMNGGVRPWRPLLLRQPHIIIKLVYCPSSKNSHAILVAKSYRSVHTVTKLVACTAHDFLLCNYWDK